MKPRAAEVVIALAGQPNCGKSTLFNAVAGFKVDTGNFAGTTVSYHQTSVTFAGRRIRLIDLPGTYSISSHDIAEKVARDYLLSGEADVVINLVDSSLLSRSLELTLQLIEMGVPLVVALNMADEARRKGIEVDPEKFQALTGVPAFPVVAVQGIGIPELFEAALRLQEDKPQPIKPTYDRDVEGCITRILAAYPPKLRERVHADDRFVVVRLLEMDEEFERFAEEVHPEFLDFVRAQRRHLAEQHGWPETSVLASHRHALVLDLYEQVVTERPRGQPSLGARLDAFILNPAGGLIAVMGSLFLMFFVSFWLGDQISHGIQGPLSILGARLKPHLTGFLGVLLSGLYDGVVAGAGIVLPYLAPLLLMLAVFEESGMLPRIAFMVDGLLHRVGLHGKSVVPLILGYGCNVPAIMATRNLENERDRILTMLIVPFTACSARTVVILALAGRFLGAGWTTGIYLGNLMVALALSFLLSRFQARLTTGIVMDVPPLRKPHARIIVKKVWHRLYEFLVFAWPVIVGSSILLTLLTLIGVNNFINRALAPLTSSVLGLPEQAGVPLFLGFFRKELTLVMLNQAFGTPDTSAVLSNVQILVLVVFTVLYVPCLATLTTIWKEGGWRVALLSFALNLVVALLIASGLGLMVSAF